jgi:hypothetical protein
MSYSNICFVDGNTQVGFGSDICNSLFHEGIKLTRQKVQSRLQHIKYHFLISEWQFMFFSFQIIKASLFLFAQKLQYQH